MGIDTAELKVVLHAGGVSAHEKRGDDMTRMIETFMVAANEAVARHLSEEQVPLLYRCHPLPDAAKAVRFEGQAATMGLDVAMDLPGRRAGAADEGMSLLDQLRAEGGSMQLFGGGLVAPARDAPGEALPEESPETHVQETGFAQLDDDEQDTWLRPFIAAIDAIDAMPPARADVATGKLLACLGRAYYTPQNIGHFGLASTHYCHFTSPIRRYPDLVAHRNLAALMAGDQPVHDDDELDTLCDHCSEQERVAAELERTISSAVLVLAADRFDDPIEAGPDDAEVDASDAVPSLAGHEARITGITPHSLFVRLAAGIEARVAARDLPGGPYAVDEDESMLYVSELEHPDRFPAAGADWAEWADPDTGERRKVRAILGDPVVVRLTGRDVAEGKTGAVVTRWLTRQEPGDRSP